MGNPVGGLGHRTPDRAGAVGGAPVPDQDLTAPRATRGLAVDGPAEQNGPMTQPSPASAAPDTFGARADLAVGDAVYEIYRVNAAGALIPNGTVSGPRTPRRSS